MNWEEEQPCFEGVATEVGLFYSDLSAHYSHVKKSAAAAAAGQEGEEEGDQEEEGGEEEEGEVGPVSKRYEYLLQVGSVGWFKAQTNKALPAPLASCIINPSITASP